MPDIAGSPAAVVDDNLLAERLRQREREDAPIMSDGPPGANGTTSVTARSG